MIVMVKINKSYMCGITMRSLNIQKGKILMKGGKKQCFLKKKISSLYI